MALVQKNNSRRTILLVIVLSVIVIGGGAYIYIQGRTPATTDDTDNLVNQQQRPIVRDFSDELFDDPRFNALEFKTPTVIVPGVIGKQNPFAPTF